MARKMSSTNLARLKAIKIEDVKRNLTYDPLTGFFFSRKTGKRRGSLMSDGRYREIYLFGLLLLEHRLAWFFMTEQWPSDEIDHRDGNHSNNAWANLRQSDHCQNNQNRPPMPSRSGLKGVYLDQRRMTWNAEIIAFRKKYYLGAYPTAELAHAAYCAKARELHGEFARTS